jgi:hypothetical protein
MGGAARLLRVRASPDAKEACIISSHHGSRGRVPALLTLSLVALLATGAAALASTLSGDGDRLTWTADAGKANSLLVTDPADGTLRITSAGDPVAGALPPDCSDASGVEPEGTVTDCTGYTEADFLAGDGDDSIDASGLDGAQRYPLVLDGGAGDDTLTGGPDVG